MRSPKGEPPSGTNQSHYYDQLAALAARYDLIAIYAFGSCAKKAAAVVCGEQARLSRDTPSDLDIGVVPRMGRRLSLDEKVKPALAPEDLFDMPRVDLVVAPDVSIWLAVDIVRGELLYTPDPVAEAEYQLYVLARANDLYPWYREAIEAFKREGIFGKKNDDAR